MDDTLEKISTEAERIEEAAFQAKLSKIEELLGSPEIQQYIVDGKVRDPRQNSEQKPPDAARGES